MNFEPQKFFIGLVGFFSIIMPGALLAYLGKDWMAETFLQESRFRLDGAEGWLVFLFVSYLLGHFAFLVGSLLDDLLYRPLRDATYRGQLRRLAEGRKLSDPRLRRFAELPWIFWRNPDGAVLHAERIKAAALTPLGASSAINAYQWCKVRLSSEHPEGLLAVERFEADSKFFRSFSVVLFVLFLVLLWQLRIIAAAACALLVIPALWRYADQRFKATQQAYWFVIGLEGERVKGDSSALGRRLVAPVPDADGITHAGGVVYRRRAKAIEYLVVEASGGTGEWVLPKGHIEPFEDRRETAVREVREEAGVWARIVQAIDDVDLLVGSRSLAVRFYLMEAVEEVAAPLGEPAGEGRRQRWEILEDALAAATHEETRELLAKADRLRSFG